MQSAFKLAAGSGSSRRAFQASTGFKHVPLQAYHRHARQPRAAAGPANAYQQGGPYYSSQQQQQQQQGPSKPRQQQAAYAEEDGWDASASAPPQASNPFGNALDSFTAWAGGVITNLVDAITDAFLLSPIAPAEAPRPAVETSVRGALALLGLVLLQSMLSFVLTIGAIVLAIYTATQVYGWQIPIPGGEPPRAGPRWATPDGPGPSASGPYGSGPYTGYGSSSSSGSRYYGAGSSQGQAGGSAGEAGGYDSRRQQQYGGAGGGGSSRQGGYQGSPGYGERQAGGSSPYQRQQWQQQQGGGARGWGPRQPGPGFGPKRGGQSDIIDVFYE